MIKIEQKLIENIKCCQGQISELIVEGIKGLLVKIKELYERI